MDTSFIKNQLQYSIPEELYYIEPDQIVYFVSSDGLVDQEDLMTLNSFFSCLRDLHCDYRFKVRLVPTSNQLLIDTIAGRAPEESDVPYKVFVGAWDTIPGIVSHYYGEDVEKVVEKMRLPRWRGTGTRQGTDSPAIVTIDPANRPAQKQGRDIDSSYQSGFDMEV
ncbi:MAG: hypothetical protein II659_06975, partial [Bacteroidales bacterium]|nr:hypothetical protein [Bacteroidales bacterium]